MYNKIFNCLANVDNKMPTEKKFFNVQVRLNLANYLSKFKLKDKKKVAAIKDKIGPILHLLNFETLNLWNSNSLTRNLIKSHVFTHCSKISKSFQIMYNEIFQLENRRITIQKINTKNSK